METNELRDQMIDAVGSVFVKLAGKLDRYSVIEVTCQLGMNGPFLPINMCMPMGRTWSAAEDEEERKLRRELIVALVAALNQALPEVRFEPLESMVGWQTARPLWWRQDSISILPPVGEWQLVNWPWPNGLVLRHERADA